MFRNGGYIAHQREKDGEIQSLSDHLEEVSKKTGEFASRIGLKEQGELLGLLHDIGKASREFDKYIKSSVGILNPDEDDYIDAKGMKGKVDHSTAGAQLIHRHVAEKGPEGLLTAEVLSLCLSSHHSGLIDCISPEGIDAYSKRMRKKEEESHVDEVVGKLSDEAKARLLDRLGSRDLVETLINKFMTLRTSHDSFETLGFKCGLMVRFLFSCLIDSDRLSTADFEAPALAKLRNYGAYEDWPVLIERLDQRVRSFESKGINVERQKISQACYDFADRPKGVYQLTVPTGGGKTFASLRFALHHALHHAEKAETAEQKIERIIYALPYTTIIDQNAEEIRKVLETKDKDGKYLDRIVLEHHSNLTPQQETARQKVLAENWDAPVVLTTNVQVLETLFGSGTRGARRMHQLANAVIIFDEIQTLPIKCVQLFNLAINFLVNCCGSTVVLCTATQPLLNRIEPKTRALPITEKQQIVPDATRLFDDLKRVEVYDGTKIGGWTNGEIKELVRQQGVKSGSALVVVNTKTSAKQIYQQCTQLDNIQAYHLSTHMCPAHRMDVLNQIKSCLRPSDFGLYGPPKPVICVSTQLIEAGVDISFGSVIRFVAGLDSIAQAAGRCNRHNEQYPALGEVYIINPAEENVEHLIDIKMGKEKTARLLSEFKDNPGKFNNDILGPLAMEQYYLYYFFERAKEMDYPVGSNSAVGREDNLFNLLSRNTLSVEEYKRVNDNKEPGTPLRQSFMSAAKSFEVIESLGRGVIVPYGAEGGDIISKLCSAMEIDKQHELLRHAQRYSVNVLPNVFLRLLNQGAIREVQKGSGILYLDDRYYCDEYGLSEVPKKYMRLLNG